jgi:hypothetical protein
MLQELYELPDGLLDSKAHELDALLGGPTLLHLPGRREPALFVSVLMHGNETVGWEAARLLLARNGAESGFNLPRALSIFIGNVRAAAANVRRLAGQPDYNRVWPGSSEPVTPEHGMMQQVVDIMARRGIFASVDVHNNTGINPHYGCVNVLDNRFLHLATLFSRTVVYFIRPTGVQSMAMARLCPAVTLECGKVGHEHGVVHALDYLDACLHLSEHPTHPVAEHDIDLFHTVAQVKLPASLRFSTNGETADLLFSPQLDRMNFRELPPGTVLGTVADNCAVCLDVRDEQGRDVASRYFEVEDNELRFRVPVMPSMLTLNEQVIRQDCLCYIMERYNDHVPASG